MSNSIATSVHVQRSRLDEIGLGDPDFTIELIDIMLEDGLERTRTLRAAYQAERMAEVAAIAHALKGSALNIGAVTLAQLCAEIDNTVRKLGQMISEQDVAMVEVEFSIVADELTTIKRDLTE
ncbi:MAG: Hpt domain-containing protein [bacterium]|nr:Hpt domain-containing protein [bacterium]